MGETRTDQLSFRVDRDLLERLDEACSVEDLKRADLARKIFAWAFGEFERAGSLHALRTGRRAGDGQERRTRSDRRTGRDKDGKKREAS